MQLTLQNFASIVQNAAAAVQSASAQLLDLTVGSVLRAILEANAYCTMDAVAYSSSLAEHARGDLLRRRFGQMDGGFLAVTTTGLRVVWEGNILQIYPYAGNPDPRWGLGENGRR